MSSQQRTAKARSMNANSSASPTILVPGITGTTLLDSNTLAFDTIWSGVQKHFETISDLELQSDPTYGYSELALIERGNVERLAYGEIVGQLKRKVNPSVFIFGYDWRLSNRTNGERLRKYVDHLRAKLGVDQFNFVTHSMGGIVLSCYLQQIQPDFSSIDRIVFTACPFRGSVDAIAGMVRGEGGSRFPFLNDRDEFRKIARTFPSVYELAPVYKGAWVRADGEDFDLYDPDHWQSNVASHSIVQRRIDELKVFRSSSPAMFDLGDLPEELRRRTCIVVGRGEETRDKITVQQHDDDRRVRNFFDFNSSNTEGDGRVLSASSDIYKDRIVTICVQSKWFDGATHGFFLNDGRVQAVVNRFLNGATTYTKWWSAIGGTVRRLT